MADFLKIVVFVPVTHADVIRAALADSGCGKMGNYDACSFSVRGVGRFRPLKGAQPFIGTEGKVEEVEEERIETICAKSNLKKALAAVRKVHPYEAPAIDVYDLTNMN